MITPIFAEFSVAIATSFKDRKIGYEKFRQLVDSHAQSGAASITVAGTTGECSTLTDDEQIELI